MTSIEKPFNCGVCQDNVDMANGEPMACRQCIYKNVRCAVPFVQLTSHERDPNSLKTFQEASDIKLAEVIKGHLGLSMGLSFDMLTKENQIVIGKRLELILGIVANGALVPLIDCTLNERDVKELASNRGIIARERVDMKDSKWKENMSTLTADKTNEVKRGELGSASEREEQRQRENGDSYSRLAEADKVIHSRKLMEMTRGS